MAIFRGYIEVEIKGTETIYVECEAETREEAERLFEEDYLKYEVERDLEYDGYGSHLTVEN